MSDDDDKQRAIAAISEKLKAIRFTSEQVKTQRDAGTLDAAYANSVLNQLDAQRSDLESEQDTIVLTGPVTTAPTQSEVDSLAAAVRALQARNVTADTIKSIVNDTFDIIGGAARAEAPSSASRGDQSRTVAVERPEIAEPALLVVSAFAAGIAVGALLYGLAAGSLRAGR